MSSHEISQVMGGYLDENQKLMSRAELNKRIAMKDARIKELEEAMVDVRGWLRRTCENDPKHPFKIYSDVLDKALSNEQH